MATVVFRCDGEPEIGSGHVMRCLALAATFMDGGWRVAFAATKATFSSIAALESATVDRLIVSGHAGAEPNELLARWPDGVELLVVDHYHRDTEFERACRGWARRIVIIDDLADRPHDADVLADSTRAKSAYRGLVPETCKVLAGPAYAVVAARFRSVRDEAMQRRDGRPAERILVSFGQVDAVGVTIRALDTLKTAGFAGVIEVVLGRKSPHLKSVLARADDCIRVHVDADNMPALMAAADLAFGAGGTTAWERCCLALPTILVSIADNQRHVAAEIASAGAGIDVGVMDSEVSLRMTKALTQMLADGQRRQAMAGAAAALVDGRACDRILAAAIGVAADRHGNAINVRPAEYDDERWLLELQREPLTRRFANEPKSPSSDQHRKWLSATFGNTKRLLLIAERSGERAAMLRLDRRADATRISIAVHPSFHQRGIGAAVLALAARISPGRPLDAEILPGNRASLALFTKSGYRRLGDTLFRCIPQ